MPHSKIALLLIVACALPSAVGALGLGEIHVTSALNEPLAAEVDIVGATAEDLAGITASIANRETFLRYGVDRPAFLSSASLKVATDHRGLPVLAVRSTDAFTEPLINVLIDLHWRSGEVIRQYALLLDPPGFPSDTRVAEAVPAAGDSSASHAAPAAPETERTSALVREPPQPEAVKVAAGETLNGIASRVSSRGNADRERMMIAIFRANPQAFEGNINRLRRGVVLAIPSAPEVSKISSAEARQEIHSQMNSWHAPAPIAPAAEAPAPAETPDDASLGRRVQLLEKGLNELQGTLGREQQTLASIRSSVAVADEAPPIAAVPPPSRSGHALGTTLVALLVLAGAALGVRYAWRRQQMRYYLPATNAATAVVRAAASPEPTSAAPVRKEESSIVRIETGPMDEFTIPEPAEPADPATSDTAEVANLASTTLETRAVDVDADTTPLKAVRAADVAALDMPEESNEAASVPANARGSDKLDSDTAKLRYRLLDIDGTVHHEKGQFKERRTSLVDVLKVAVKREPNRRDLRMKLLETYYAAAATGRQGFLEVAQSLAGERANMADAEWAKVAGMGRLIAADHDLFTARSGQPGDNDLATCA